MQEIAKDTNNTLHIKQTNDEVGLQRPVHADPYEILYMYEYVDKKN